MESFRGEDIIIRVSVDNTYDVTHADYYEFSIYPDGDSANSILITSNPHTTREGCEVSIEDGIIVCKVSSAITTEMRLGSYTIEMKYNNGQSIDIIKRISAFFLNDTAIAPNFIKLRTCSHERGIVFVGETSIPPYNENIYDYDKIAKSYTKDSKVQMNAIANEPKYMFKCWSDGNTDKVRVIDSIKENYDLIAIFERKGCDVDIIASNSNGTVRLFPKSACVNNIYVKVPFSSVISVTAVPDKNHSLKIWQTSLDGKNWVDIEKDDDNTMEFNVPSDDVSSKMFIKAVFTE